MDDLPYVDLDAVRDQFAAWLDLHTSPGGYRCLRCGDARWSILSVRRVDTTHRFQVTPGSWTAIDIGCMVCHRVETYNATQLRIIP